MHAWFTPKINAICFRENDGGAVRAITYEVIENLIANNLAPITPMRLNQQVQAPPQRHEFDSYTAYMAAKRVYERAQKYPSHDGFTGDEDETIEAGTKMTVNSRSDHPEIVAAVERTGVAPHRLRIWNNDLIVLDLTQGPSVHFPFIISSLKNGVQSKQAYATREDADVAATVYAREANVPMYVMKIEAELKKELPPVVTKDWKP